MKKLFYFLSTTLFVVTGLFSCNKTEPSPDPGKAIPTELIFASDVTDINYVYGMEFDYEYESLNKTNIPEIKIKYSDNTENTIIHNDERLTFVGYEPYKLGKQTIKVFFKDNNKIVGNTYDVTVKYNGPKITKQPEIKDVRYPEGCEIDFDFEGDQNKYSIHWQYLNSPFNSKDLYFKDLNCPGMKKVSFLSTKQGESNLRIRAEVVLNEDPTIISYTELGGYNIVNKDEKIDVIYFGEIAIKAGESVNLSETYTMSTGEVSYSEKGEITLKDVDFIDDEFHNDPILYPYSLSIETSSAVHEEYNVYIDGFNRIKNIYNDEGATLFFYVKQSRDIDKKDFSTINFKGKNNTENADSLVIEGGTMGILALHNDINFADNIDFKFLGIKYNNGSGINANKVSITNSNVFIQTGLFGISASKDMTIDNSTLDINLYPTKVNYQNQSVGGINAPYAKLEIKNNSNVKINIVINSSIFMITMSSLYPIDGVFVNDLLMNTSQLSIEITSSEHPIYEGFYVGQISGAKTETFEAKENSEFNIKINCPNADKVQGIYASNYIKIDGSSFDINIVGNGDVYGMKNQNKREGEKGINISGSNGNIVIDSGEKIDWCPQNCFGMMAYSFNIDMSESNSITIELKKDNGATLAAVTGTSENEVKFDETYVPKVFKGDINFKLKENTQKFNCASMKTETSEEEQSYYIVYETPYDTNDEPKVAKNITLVSIN